jgi:hypothetical protein
MKKRCYQYSSVLLFLYYVTYCYLDLFFVFLVLTWWWLQKKANRAIYFFLNFYFFFASVKVLWSWNISSILTYTKRSFVNYLSSALMDWQTLPIFARSLLPYWEFNMVPPKSDAEQLIIFPLCLVAIVWYNWVHKRRQNSVIGADFASFSLILQPDKGRFLHFDHVTFWVGNAKQVNRLSI